MGECQTIPIGEAADRRPLSAYGAYKYGLRLQTRLLRPICTAFPLWMRFFNIYGPRQSAVTYSGVISIFCEPHSLRQNPILILVR